MTIARDGLADALGAYVENGAEEILYQSTRTRVTRQRLAGAGTVIRKEPLGPSSLKRIRHETAILQRLAGVDGVPRIVAVDPGGTAIVLDDPGTAVLADSMSAARFELPRFLDLAEGLIGIVAAVHRRGVIHKDINPANIVLTGTDRKPVLIDYDLATVVAEERPGFTHQREIVGTLAYLAPEQTGRTGRPVDQRADLYAVGATLYALATGGPPFGDGDLLQLIHDHLARVPVPPAEVNPALPQALSDIILRLLEKEPDRRYQSAEGIAYDIARLRDHPAAGGSRLFPLGERDFPLRLLPPSRLVGRDAEIERLRTAFEAAVQGDGRGLLVAGAPGVGKTALIDELRPIVTAAGGWFVTGKFDQYRHDGPDAVAQAMRALGRLLLAEPEAELVRLRARMLDALGANAGPLASLLPEFALLLDVVPETASVDLTDAKAQLFGSILDMLRVVVSPARPVVLVVDDLQWATATPISFIDAVLIDETLSGLLLVGAYREGEVDAAHPLSGMLSRWDRLGVAPTQLMLRNLPPADLGALLEEMLRLRPGQAAGLADALRARTDGNPYDTVELVNALRRDGALVPGAEGWEWDGPTLRRYVGEGDVVDLLAARIDALPQSSQRLLEILACLGGEVEFALLRAAADLSAEALDDELTAPLEDGLLVMQQGDTSRDSAVRFRHDRVQQAAYGRMVSEVRHSLHLTLGRRLAALPQYGSMAAQQYSQAVESVQDGDERRNVAGLFQAAAAQSALVNYGAAEHFLAAAMRLLEPIRAEVPEQVLATLETERHAALYRLGRLDEADAVYQVIERRGPDPMELVDPACVQISSLTNRGLARDAISLGLDLLRKLGLAVPHRDELGARIEQGLDALHRWVDDDGGHADDLRRPEVSDPLVMAAAKVINRTMPPAFFSDQPTMAWLVTEARRLWAEHGPCAALVAPICHTGVATIGLRQEYRTGYGAVRRVLEVSEARGYEPETSQARFLFAIGAGWFEPVENSVVQAQRAKEGLVHGGDLHFACFTYHASTPALLDCATTLTNFAAEVESGIAFAARTGDDQTAACSLAFRQLVRNLRGDTYTTGSFNDASFDEAAYLAGLDGNPTAAAYFHSSRAVSAALFGNSADLLTHARTAVQYMPAVQSGHPAAWMRLLLALALAEQLKVAPLDERGTMLAELDTCRDWLARRAADAPSNFRHLLRLVEAERAWAVGDLRDATYAFDAAMLEATARQRPWHLALIAERAARFHLERGLTDGGRRLLAEARRLYESWGAGAKVHELDQQYPFLRSVDRSAHSRGSFHATLNVSADAVDLLAILKASQALSSATNLGRLQSTVVQVLGEMTGAMSVRLLLWNDDAQTWLLPARDDTDEGPITVEAAAELGLLPLAAFRYVERTREPLLVADATQDDRFARDPYVARLDRCSLLVVMILIHGIPRAVLMLENSLSSGVFSAERLDAVELVAGQLAVSLDNAMVYASLEEKVAERTEALGVANAQLEVLSITDPLTGLANRRQLTQALEAEWNRALGVAGSMAAAMIDIDLFKAYNDHYGHQAGDVCLRRVAETLRATVRDSDLVTRYGGEEFAIILPGADLATAFQVAERARAAVVALNEEHAGSAAGMVTVSIGIAAVVPSEHATADQLIKRADAELYEAKRNGRNQVAGMRVDRRSRSPR